MAFIDTRQFHPGHTLVIPKKHFADVRELGPTAFQEVPHCHIHIHIHPRRTGDDFLRVYPSAPVKPDREVREELCEGKGML